MAQTSTYFIVKVFDPVAVVLLLLAHLLFELGQLDNRLRLWGFGCCCGFES